jgi:hypothetical protein
MKPFSAFEKTFSNRKILVPHAAAKSGYREQALGAAWIEWPNRLTLHGVTYAPGEPVITDEQLVNTWHGWGCEPRRGSTALWRQLLDHLFAGDAAAVLWFERWLAYPLQHPGTKMASAVLIWGPAQGTGKSLVGYHVGRIYGKNFAEISPMELHSPFNEWQVGKAFIMGDEIAGEDRRADTEHIKRLVTQQHVRVNQKFVGSYAVPDVCNYYFTSNYPDALRIDRYDRRFFVWRTPNEPLPARFYRDYDKWYRGDGAGHLFHHLLHLDLDGVEPMSPPPFTAHKSEMIGVASSDLDSWVASLSTESSPLRAMGNESDLVTSEQLFTVFSIERGGTVGRLTRNGMARALSRAGHVAVNGGSPVRVSSKEVTVLYAIRDHERWARAPHSEVVEHYRKHHKALQGGEF